ncbi:MAG: Uma2 family endonuclease [Polyangiaceae bacterium]
MRNRPSHAMLCPPKDGGPALRLPGKSNAPAPDDRLAPPETRVEYVRGVEVFAAPADEPHAHQHSQIDRVVGAHVKNPYAVAVDMLTRVDDASDFAPDVSVYEPIFDRKTKQKTGRKLEEIAFEVIDKQAQSVPTKKAMDLVARGVRRVFCVVVRDRQLSEWSRKHGRWEPLAPGALIEDRCFVRPMRADALVSSLLADDEIARALLVKRPPAIEAALQEVRTEGHAEGHAEGRAEGHAEGRAEGHTKGLIAGKQQSVLRILEKRGLTIPKRLHARIVATTDIALLDRWLDEAITVEKASDLPS